MVRVARAAVGSERSGGDDADGSGNVVVVVVVGGGVWCVVWGGGGGVCSREGVGPPNIIVGVVTFCSSKLAQLRRLDLATKWLLRPHNWLLRPIALLCHGERRGEESCCEGQG